MVLAVLSSQSFPYNTPTLYTMGSLAENEDTVVQISKTIHKGQ